MVECYKNYVEVGRYGIRYELIMLVILWSKEEGGNCKLLGVM